MELTPHLTSSLRHLLPTEKEKHLYQAFARSKHPFASPRGEGGGPASNTVPFNNVAATVSAATTTTLTVTLPSGATTGLIFATVATLPQTASGIAQWVGKPFPA